MITHTALKSTADQTLSIVFFIKNELFKPQSMVFFWVKSIGVIKEGDRGIHALSFCEAASTTSPIFPDSKEYQNASKA